MRALLFDAGFDPWRIMADYQAERSGLNGKYGALSVFVGSMRDFNLGDEVQAMHLEHYPGMTEAQLELICREAAERWPLLDALVAHRVGAVAPGEAIVLAAAWAEQRGDACDACRYIVEGLKSRAPFWKREVLRGGGSRWVAGNSDGYRK